MTDDDTLYAYLDTNALLEFRAPKDNDWNALLGAKSVVLVITRVVLRELQDHKDGRTRVPQRKRDRAAARLKDCELWLASMEPTQIKKGVAVVYRSKPTPPDLFVAHDLDPASNDSKIVAAALAGQAEGQRVCVVANDTGTRVDAARSQVVAFDLDEAWRVQDEPDPHEAELRRAKADLAVAKQRDPKLVLALPGGESFLRFEVPKPRLPVDDWVPQELAGVRAHLELMQLGRSNALVAADEQRRFARETESFLTEVEKRLPTLIEQRNRIDRVVTLEGLGVANQGNAPAEGVEVTLRLPSGVRRLLELPTVDLLPPRPRPMRTVYDQLASAGVTNRAILSYERARLGLHKLADIRTPSWTASGDAELVTKLGSARHEKVVALPSCYLELEEASGFRLEFSIGAANLPTSVRQTVDVRVEYGSFRTPLSMRCEGDPEDDEGEDAP